MTLHLFVSPQKSREANRDLQIQLDQVLQQAQDPNSRGNSLFAEVTTKALDWLAASTLVYLAEVLQEQ